MSYVNFREIKETITVEQAMIYLGLKMKAEEGAYRSECPTCKAGGNRAQLLRPKSLRFIAILRRRAATLYLSLPTFTALA